MKSRLSVSGKVTELHDQSVSSYDGLPSHQEEKLVLLDVLSLYAHDSQSESDRLSVDNVKEARLDSSQCEVESGHVSTGENDLSY